MSDRVPTNFFETTMHFTMSGQSGDIICSLGWSGGDASDPPDFAGVDTALGGLQGNVSAGCVMDVISYNLGSTATDNPTHDESVNFPGLASGTVHGLATCILVQKRSLEGGRRHRGRVYYPGAEKNSVGGDGIIDSGVVTGLQTNWDDMVTEMQGMGYAPNLFHQTAPFSPTGVSTFSVQAKIATQRTRLRD